MVKLDTHDDLVGDEFYVPSIVLRGWAFISSFLVLAVHLMSLDEFI